MFELTLPVILNIIIIILLIITIMKDKEGYVGGNRERDVPVNNYAPNQKIVKKINQYMLDNA